VAILSLGWVLNQISVVRVFCLVVAFSAGQYTGNTVYRIPRYFHQTFLKVLTFKYMGYVGIGMREARHLVLEFN